MRLKPNVKTPYNLVERMVDKIDFRKYRDIADIKVCDMACKDISFIVCMAEKLYKLINKSKRVKTRHRLNASADIYRHIFSKMIYAYCIDDVDYELVKRFIKKTYGVQYGNISINNIYLNYVINDTENMKFDICLMNPPYSTKEHRTYAPRAFLKKGIEISDLVVGVMPVSRIIGRGKDMCMELMSCFDINGVDIESIEPADYFDAYITAKTCVIKYDRKSADKKVVIDGITYDSVTEYVVNPGLSSFDNAIANDYRKDNVMNHITYTDLSGTKIVNFLRYHIYCNNSPDPEKYVVNIAYRPGKGITVPPKKDISKWSGKFADVYSGVNRSVAYFAFDTNDEMNNFVNYVKTDFFRAAVSITQKSNNILGGELDTVPWFDFTDKMFSKSPREIDNILFARYKISGETRHYIEEMLDDVYEIRKK